MTMLRKRLLVRMNVRLVRRRLLHIPTKIAV
jgi:hypothetical protein